MQFEKWYDVDLLKPRPFVPDLGFPTFEGDNNSVRIGVNLFKNKTVEAATGTIKGYCILPNGVALVPFDGAKDGNKAWIDLPDNALVMDGRITVSIRCFDANETTVLFQASATVRRVDATSHYDPDDEIGDITDLIEEAEQAAQDAAQAAQDAQAALAQASNIVSYEEQTGQTDAEKAQARENISAASEDDVSDLKGAFVHDVIDASIEYYPYSAANYWQSGYINPTNGANASDSKRIRMRAIDFLSSDAGAGYVTVKNGYLMQIFAYESDGTYVGAWDGSTFSKTWHYIGVSDFFILEYPQYKFRVCLKRSDDGEMTTAEFINFVVYSSKSKLGRTAEAQEIVKRTSDYASLFTQNRVLLANGYSTSTSDNYKMTDPIYLKAGESVEFCLNGENANSVFAAYSALPASSETLLTNVVARGTTTKTTGVYTAENDVYVVLCRYTRFDFFAQKIGYVKFNVSLFPAVAELTNTRILHNANVRSICHRGFASQAPENTIPAFALAKVNGFDWVETDVRYTSDNVPVLLHDETVNRTSNGTGNISDMTYEQARELDFGSWYSEKYTGTKIPSFDEFVLFCKQAGLKIYIELKVAPVSTLVAIVKKYRMQNNVKWISFSSTLLASVIELLPNSDVAYIVPSGIYSADITTANSLKTGKNSVSIETTDYSAITDNMVSMLIENDLEIEIYTGSANVSYQANQYISAITSDGFIGGDEMARHVLWKFM